jgi:hypothetical protein
LGASKLRSIGWHLEAHPRTASYTPAHHKEHLTHTYPPTHTPSPPAGVDPDAEEKRKRDEEEAARAAARAHGTPVTVEAFMAWKAAYDAGARGRMHLVWCWCAGVTRLTACSRAVTHCDLTLVTPQ